MEVFGVVVVIANCDRQHLLRLLLLDYKSIQMRLDIAGQKIKDELVAIDLCCFFFSFGFGRFGRSKGGKRDPVAKVRFHELGDLGFELFWRRERWWSLFHAGRQNAARESNMAKIAVNSDS